MIELPVKMAAPGITDAPATVRMMIPSTVYVGGPAVLPWLLPGLGQRRRGGYFTFTTDGRYVLGLGVRDQSINLLTYVEDAHPAIISKREFR